MTISHQKCALLTMLCWLTFFAIILQINLFAIHQQTGELFDVFVSASLGKSLLHQAILLPLLTFIFLQLIAYFLFTLWIWFTAVSTSEFFTLSKTTTYWMGMALWLIGCMSIIAFNNYYFSNSFFATLFRQHHWYDFQTNLRCLTFSTTLLLIATAIALLNLIIYRRHLISGSILASLTLLSLYVTYATPPSSLSKPSHTAPTIIFIGLDSVRPDFIHYFGYRNTITPHIDHFLSSSAVLTHAYTPLARTFPAWVSILTSQHPKFSHARNNLAEPSNISANDTLAKQLQRHGYETIYATDEKRFSNITEHYGFDTVIGPRAGVNDFLLGGLSDFPLTNILINTPLGRIVFPYNYSNRAAAVTYEPHSFLKLIQQSLDQPHSKPLFLAIHLCLSHWPFFWAHDNQHDDFTLAKRYRSSVEAVDTQFGDIMTMLKQKGLLDHSIVVLLSDHGTTVGLPHDRIISKENYRGDPAKLHLITVYPLETHSPQTDRFTINTSYGQGSDILSVKQYHVLLAFQGFGIPLQQKTIPERTSLLDIAPTILDFLHLEPFKTSNGLSLYPYLTTTNYTAFPKRPAFFETGYTIAEMETDDINTNQVLRQAIGAYAINPSNGLITMKPFLEKSIIKSKQRAVLLDDWLLARYPASTRMTLNLKNAHPQLTPLIQPAYYVLVNTKTKKWTIEETASLHRNATTRHLLNTFTQFYGEEI